MNAKDKEATIKEKMEQIVKEVKERAAKKQAARDSEQEAEQETDSSEQKIEKREQLKQRAETKAITATKATKEKKEEITKEKAKQAPKLTKESAKKLLIPAEDYKNAAAIFGTKVITGYMEEYVYKRRADGLAIINVEKTDAKIQAASNFLAQFDAKDILVFCKREAGWKAAEKFQEITGARVFIRRYPSGNITNPGLPDFFEPKVLLVIDPWIDKNAIFDAMRIGIPVISLCDTNNVTNNVDLVVPCNNKTKTSIGLVFYLITKGYAKAKGLPFKAKLEDFGGNGEDGESK